MQRIQIIGLIFVVIGAIGWGLTVFALGYSGSLRIGIDLLLLPIGIGLLRFKERGRVNALRVLALLAVLVVTLTVVSIRIDALVSSGPYPAWVPSLTPEQQMLVISAWAAVQLAVIGWMAWQLLRKEHRSRFNGDMR